MKWVLGLIFAISFFFTVDANASDVWTGYKHITTIEGVGNGGFLITFDSVIPNGTCNAANNSGATLYIYPNENGVTIDGAKAFLAMALDAMNTGMQVTVGFDAADPHCFGNYLVVKK